MPFLRKKKGSKSVSTDGDSQTNDESAQITIADSSSTSKESRIKFGRKKKNKAAETKGSDRQVAIETHPVGPLGANSIPPRGLSIPAPQQNAHQSKRNAASSQTITTTSTSNTSANQSNTSSVSALFDHKKTNALQQRQLSHTKQVGSNTRSINNGGGSARQTQQSYNQQQNMGGKNPQSKQPQTDLFAGMPANPPTAVPITRSGWSMVSNASTAMNSVQYIESLDDLPGSPSIRGKQFPVLNSQSDDRIRSSLSRPFGRSHLPSTFQPKWEVSVEPPNWDMDEGRFKYKINMVRLPTVKRNEDIRQSSYNVASTTRSLQDFVWLERALRAEYHGAMLVPLLSLALWFNTSKDEEDNASVTSKTTVSDGSRMMPLDGNVTSQSIGYLEDKMDKNEIVDTSILANWLSDIFNGVRGDGEWILHGRGDVAESEAVETFLFRHTELLKEPSRMGRIDINPCRASGLGSPFNLFSILGGDREDGCNRSLFDNFLENPFACFGSETAATRQDSEKLTLSKMCSSGATGVPGIKGCNSNLSTGSIEDDFAGFQMSSSTIATHSELLEAERDLIASHIRCSTVAMTKVNSLAKDEAYVGQCWKRLAISLSNLFSVEKDLETAHIGDQIKSSKKNQPFRKLRKTAVDDGLRILARGKVDRARPSLATLRAMMDAYYADLNSVVPAFKEYRDAINQLHELNEMASVSSSRRGTWNSSQRDDWTSSLKALTSNIAKHITGPGEEKTLDSDATSEEGMYSLNTTQSRALQTRVLTHERMLKYSITSLCKACPLRTARMAWWYLKQEVKQASSVHAAATALRQTLSIDADTALAMKERHYEEDEAKSNDAEIELVKRILDLGANQGDEVDYADLEIRRQHALRMAMQHVGRWNAETALAVMEAAGVDDAEVQMDETSRELRHVRKFAISLRENVIRCREAAQQLAACFIRNDNNPLLIARSRREFWAAISTVFSGRLMSDQDQDGISFPSTRVLSAVGISTNDKGGWLGHDDESKNQRRRNCGEVARRYLKKRDNQANILISRVLKLLSEYEQRLEGIESFVYMHCVGIQLEKHCSKRRAKALSSWEKRTDISTAINVATKKRIPKLVQELKVKLDALPQVSHTTVIKAKESHLTSKTLKSELHKLANKRFGRAQEVSTERVIAIMSLWAKHEESVAIEEVRALGEAVQEVELSIEGTDIDAVIDKTLAPDTRVKSGVVSEVRRAEGRSGIHQGGIKRKPLEGVLM